MIRMACAFLLAAGLAHYLTPMLRQAAIRFGIVDRPDGKLKNPAFVDKAPVDVVGQARAKLDEQRAAPEGGVRLARREVDDAIDEQPLAGEEVLHDASPPTPA